jgi:phosphate transport system protein
MAGHRREFDSSLDHIEAKVIELFAMIAEDLPAAARCLLDDSGETARTLAEREQLINALYVEIENLASREIVLQAPVASDLRYLLTVLRVVPELERSHDLVISIASRAGHIPAADLSPAILDLTAQMAGLAARMWQQAADAWYDRDRTAATALSEHDMQMDLLDTRLTAEITAPHMPVCSAMDMALTARDYERLGAHAVNITRRITYLAGRAES